MGNKKIKIACVKYAGLAVGGSELWLQKLAAFLPKDRYEVDYYYCDAAPYIGSNYFHVTTDPIRGQFLRDHGVTPIEFKVGAKDVRTRKHIWRNTNFFEVFDASKYDIVQTVKAGGIEYPFYLLKVPIVEVVALGYSVDPSRNIAWSFHSSPWQRAQWVRLGGSIKKSSVLPAPIEKPLTDKNYRQELSIPEDAIVAGFHQRTDDEIFSPIPLIAFSKCQDNNWHFIIKGGSIKYREQAKELHLKNFHFIEKCAEAINISKFLNTIDIFAHGRKDGETFGAVLAEALMHGKPCLSHFSPTGANAQPETMGPAGMFARNQEEYTAALRKLFSDYSWRAKLTARAKKQAEDNYSIESFIDTVNEKYHEILKLPFAKKVKKEIPYGYSNYGFLYAGNLDDPSSIAHHVLVGSNPEEFEIFITKTLLSGVSTFVDIGANTGLYCFVAAKELLDSAKIYAYEPQKECFETMKRTIFLNDWEQKLIPFNIGLSDKKGTLRLHLSGTGSSFNSDFAGKGKEFTAVEVDTLDNHIRAEHIGRVDFIKIDVEGFELQALHGAEQTINKDLPIIFVEIAGKIKDDTRNYSNQNYKPTIEWLKEKNYLVWQCHRGKLIAADDQTLPTAVSMYICLHKIKHADKIEFLLHEVEKYRQKHFWFGFEKGRFLKVWYFVKNPKQFVKRIFLILKI